MGLVVSEVWSWGVIVAVLCVALCVAFLLRGREKEGGSVVRFVEDIFVGDDDDDFSRVRARRKTEFVDWKSPDVIGSIKWIEERWSKHLKRVGGEAKRNDVKNSKINLSEMCKNVKDLADREKYLQAGEAMLLLEASSRGGGRGEEVILEIGQSSYDLIRSRYCFGMEFKDRLNDTKDWTLSTDDKKNIRKVWYKPSSTKSGSIIVKVECMFKNCDIVNLMAFAKECHTCKQWIPFTRHASKVVDVKETTGIESVVHVCIGIPGIARDILLHIWCNDSLESKKFYFFCNSVGEAIAIGLVEKECQRMTLNIESTSIGKLVKSQPEFYESVLRPKFEKAKKLVTAERETVETVCGWALKDIIGGYFKRKKRRYFVYEEGVGSSINSPKILKYYESDGNVIGTTPLKIMFILGAVRGDDSERVLLVSEEMEGGGSRMVKLEFDNKGVREEMAMKLV
ncbi:hypothetical protein TrST_g7568 [Triparma strigata]|uniref:Uncharacterized protein n=1 Tax=Triparma strigata TaxID=1606541 RepID=A0A9W7AU30_9STRA|nr:hypothetical protein TrST_g7568 [Triparma strigata]